jgi:hypothetical protein
MNRGLFKLNCDVHSIETRQQVDMHMLSSKLTLFQKGVQYPGSKIFDHLPSSIKDLSNDVKSFKVALKMWMNFLRDKTKDFGLCINLYYKYTLFQHMIYVKNVIIYITHINFHIF